MLGPCQRLHEPWPVRFECSPRGAVNAHDSLRKVLGYATATIVEGACVAIPITAAMVGDDGLIADASVRDQIATALTTLVAHTHSRSDDLHTA